MLLLTVNAALSVICDFYSVQKWEWQNTRGYFNIIAGRRRDFLGVAVQTPAQAKEKDDNNPTSVLIL